MLAVDSFIYGVLFVYLDEIFPGKHGIGRPWHYVFSWEYWSPNRGVTGVTSPEQFQRGIELRNVVKYYTSRGRVTRAVNDISTRFRENEISTILGYNGSGKTTTLKMLAAMHSPSSGDIFINGRNLATNSTTIRKTLGYCPQYNMLIEDLTVLEHLQLFASLKGLHGDDKDDEVEMSIKKLMFVEHRDTLVQHLSGGMKRKLSLGLALCGHPSVVILDEPTCGMDTDARKVTWELLLNHREGRTIIVSSHDMEEADLVSDRCFVMSEGHIISSGSSTNLKSLNGVGYQLSVSVTSNDKPILPALQQFAPDARLIRESYKELVFSISDSDKISLINLLNHLEINGESLGVTGYGLMQSDLEEALVNVIKTQTRNDDVVDAGVPEKLSCLTKAKHCLFGLADDMETSVTSARASSRGGYTPTDSSNPYKNVCMDGRSSRHVFDKYSGVSLGFHRLKTLIKKRILDDRRNKMGILMKLVIPFLLVLFGISFLKINQKVKLYKHTCDAGGLSNVPDTLVTVDLANTGLFDPDNKKLKDFDRLLFADWTEYVRRSREEDYKSENCCSYRFLQLQHTCSELGWNSTVWKECVSSPNFGYKYCYEDCFQRDILMDYHGCSAGQRPGEHSEQTIDYFQNIFLDKSRRYLFRKYHHHALSSSVEDDELVLTAWFSAMRRHGIAQAVNVMNNMILGFYSNNTGGSITTSFWPYKKLKDSLTQASKVSLPLMIMGMFTTFAGTFITASFSLFLVKERVTKMKHLQLMTGISGRVYWYANLLWDHCVFLLFSLLTLLLLTLFSMDEFQGENGLALFLLLLAFSFATLPITHLLSMAIDSAVLCFAVVCTAGFILGMCGIMLSIYIDNTHLDSILALIPYSALGIGIVDLYTNKNLKDFNDICNCVTSFVDTPFSADKPGVGLQLLCLTIEGCVFSVLLVCVEELSVFLQLYYHRKDVRRLVQEDGDVAKERRRVTDQATYNYPVVVDSITKVLSNKLVVNNVSFGIQKKQCVALLGHNGAGKTTLFSILSGEMIPTFGSVSLFGTDMISDIRGYRERVGYCPQVPATFEHLTGREILSMFAGLRGFGKEKGSELVNRLLDWTGLTRYADMITCNYSGGTLRKLSLAISLIGDPPVLLLDEPSASVDPTSRRIMWKLLRELADSGKSILISTHIKGEVEAVCDKAVILSDGNTVAVGPCNKVKDKYGSGFSLQVSTTDPEEVDMAKAAIEHRLNSVSFVHRVGRHLQYFVPRSDYSYSEVFVAIELVQQLVKLDHYSVCQLCFTQLDLLNKRVKREKPTSDSSLRRALDVFTRGRFSSWRENTHQRRKHVTSHVSGRVKEHVVALEDLDLGDSAEDSAASSSEVLCNPVLQSGSSSDSIIVEDV